MSFKLVLLRERSDRKGPRAPEAEFGERSDRKGPRAPEAEFGERSDRKGQRIVEPQLDWRSSTGSTAGLPARVKQWSCHAVVGTCHVLGFDIRHG
ncbi:MAG: hypothetical protein QG646_3414 [Euryarchaeota archaeon]|nr:hypothetical protein [Euryarchaeota archaeon]